MSVADRRLSTWASHSKTKGDVLSPLKCAMQLVQRCLHVQWKSIHCGYVPEEEPAPPPNTKLVIEPQIDPLQAEKMFVDYVAHLAERCADSS